ncbi:hypothetical protein [Methanobrevibacter sp.]
MILGIGSSFASDFNETLQSEVSDCASVEGVDLNDDIQQDESEDVLRATDDEDVLSDTGTFGQIATKIEDSRYVELDKNYTRNGFGTSTRPYIECTHSITIDGKGHYIDSQNGGTIFYIHTNELVQFKNITFKNVNGFTISGQTMHGGNIIFSDCNFINTKGVLSIGDVESNEIRASFSNINVINCTPTAFGAFRFISSLRANFTNVLFYNVETIPNNYGNSRGGALYFNGDFNGILKNMRFINTKANEGGAIYFEGHFYGAIINSSFINCSVPNYYDGGAILYKLSCDNQFDGVNFTNCSAYMGGAIYVSRETNSDFTNVNFINNTATYGGAIYFSQQTRGEFKFANFIGNRATYAGTIYSYGKIYHNFTDVNFINNSANAYSGAIYASGGMENSFRNVNFTGNAGGDGGALYSSSFNSKFELVNCFNNTATNRGGAFFLSASYGASFKDVKFINNKVASSSTSYGGGAVYITGAPASIASFERVIFEDNYVNGSGGAIYTYSNAYSSKYFMVDLVGCIFNNNTAKSGCGGAITVEYTAVKCVNCNFTNNTGINGAGIGTYNAYAIIDVADSKFIENNGAGIEIAHRLTYSDGFLSIYNSEFDRNNGTGVISRYNSNITYSNFTNNNGRGLFFEASYQNATKNNLDNVICINNSASTGSAISNSLSALNITNSKFLLNKAESTFIDVDYDKFDHIIKVKYAGGNNFINAIDSDMDVIFKNVVYFNYNDVVNTDDVYPRKNYTVANAPILIEVYSSETDLYQTFTVNADGEGIVEVEYEAPVIHHIIAYHLDDGYYTAISNVYSYSWGDFDTLQQLIYNTSEGGVLNLPRDFRYIIGVDSITKGIIINKTMIINGNNHVIDALDQSRIFKITGVDVKLNNIKFVNASGIEGAFIYTDMEKLEVNNCTFDNTASNVEWGVEYDGGAIYLVGNNNLISNSRFINLTANRGGAIYSNASDNKIYNCEFISTNANYGGAIYIDINALKNTVEHSTFTNVNSSYGGGAILWDGVDGTVKESNFTDNHVANVRYSSFAPGLINGGGAILWTADNGLITESRFKNNKAVTSITFSDAFYGGAVLVFGSHTNISNSVFENNYAQSGGAVAIMNMSYMPLEQKLVRLGYDLESLYGFDSNIIDCNFSNNFAQYGGAVILSSYKNTISKSTFTNNTAYLAGAVSMQGINGLIYDSVFENNLAHLAGAVMSGYNKTYDEPVQSNYGEYNFIPRVKFAGYNNSISDSKFINNAADAVGAVLWMDNEGTIKGTEFKYNRLTDSYDSYSKLLNQTYGVEISKQGYVSLHTNIYSGVKGLVLGLQHKEFAGALHWVGSNGLIMDDDFIENTAVKGGALLQDNPTLKISSSRFVKNNASMGGAIWATNKTSIDGSNFTANKAEFGGAIYWMGENGKVDTSKFFDNTAVNGGAIYFKGDFNEISNSEFRMNRAEYGSALYLDDRALTLNSVILLDNQASSISLLTELNITDGLVADIVFKGGDNLMNAIYTLTSNYALNDVTYWGYGGELNSDSNTPLISDLEAGQNITIELFSVSSVVPYKQINVTDINGYTRISVPITYGRYTVLVSHRQNNYYTGINDTYVIEFDLLDPFVSIDAHDIFYRQNATVGIKLLPEVSGNVTVFVDGNNFTTFKINNTYLSFEIPGLEGGMHNITVHYSGDEHYNFDERSVLIMVNPIPSDVAVYSDGGDYKSPVMVNVTVLPYDATGNVILTIENEYGLTINITNITVFTDILNNLSSGKHNVTVYYVGDNNYLPSLNSTIIEIKPVNLTAKAYANPQMVYASSNPDIAIEVPSDFNGKVRITVGDKSNEYDVVGSTNILFDKLTVGNKQATLNFFGDKNYNNLTLNVSFEVIPVANISGEFGTVNADNMTRGYNSPFDYQAAFLDFDGSALANIDVVFKVNGKEYSAKTNASGIAQLTVSKLNVGTYKITSINKATGEEVVRELKIVPRIILNKDMTVDFNRGKYYVVKVIGDDGNIAPKGEIIDIYANTIHYVSKVDEKGYARLLINLNPKTYKLVVEYKTFKTTNKLVVKQTMKLVKKTVKVKKGKKIVLKVKLKWSNGKAIKGKLIKFKFKNKIYKSKSNKKGIAKVTIKKKSVLKKLKKGKTYKYYAIYIKNKVKGKVKIKK